MPLYYYKSKKHIKFAKQIYFVAQQRLLLKDYRMKGGIHLKRAFNEQFKTHITNKEMNLDMLLQGYAKLNREVSRLAYLKKKWANGGSSNQCYEQDFKTTIQKRNIIEKILKVSYCMDTNEIKDTINSMEILITKTNCDLLVNLLSSNDYTLLDVKK